MGKILFEDQKQWTKREEVPTEEKWKEKKRWCLQFNTPLRKP